MTGGWQLSGIQTIHTGFPFTLTGGNLNTGGDITLPDRVANGGLGDRAATVVRPHGVPQNRLQHSESSGTLSLWQLRHRYPEGPGEHNLDLAAMKNWRVPALGEQFKVQFRTEFFNALNHPNFGTPTGLSYASNNSVIPDGVSGGVRVGEIRSLNTPMRILQFALKIYF